MTDQIAPAAHADETAMPNATHAAPAAPDVAADAHGMRPIAVAFVMGNVAVLAVFALVAATGHLDVGAGGLGDVLLSSATAAPSN